MLAFVAIPSNLHKYTESSPNSICQHFYCAKLSEIIFPIATCYRSDNSPAEWSDTKLNIASTIEVLFPLPQSAAQEIFS